MILVNEIFGPTIQGEGKNAGKPVAFLRLAGCNLHCIWCDTPHTWNWTGTKFAHPDKFDKSQEVHKMTPNQIWQKLLATKMKSLVISGGEPFLQQARLIPLLEILKANNWFVEVETNGTIAPIEQFQQLVDQINCSPKLKSSLDSEKLRIRPDALLALSQSPKANFKFVISERSDINQVLDLVHRFNFGEVRLMPMATTKRELEFREPLIRRLCQQYNLIYCTRLSIEMSGTKRGV